MDEVISLAIHFACFLGFSVFLLHLNKNVGTRNSRLFTWWVMWASVLIMMVILFVLGISVGEVLDNG